MFKVIDYHTKKSYGAIDIDGTVIYQINRNNGFLLEKVFRFKIDEFNNNKRYDIAKNELKSLKVGESITKGITYYDNNYGTSLRFLTFQRL